MTISQHLGRGVLRAAASHGCAHGAAEHPHRARSAFESALAKHDAFKETRVNESAGRVTFTRVPIGSVALFAKVIATVKVPAVK